VGPHLIAPYGFWGHTNNATRKKSIFLNTTNNNFLEGTNYNYSCTPVTSPRKCNWELLIQCLISLRVLQ
jgi:hypothetical protein